MTDPYFLDRNLVAGVDLFFIQTNFLGTEPYDEKRVGFACAPAMISTIICARSGAIRWSIANRLQRGSRRQPLIVQEQGYTLLSQISQVHHARPPRQQGRPAYRLSRCTSVPTSPDLAAMRSFVRSNVNGQYYIPLDRFTGNSDWGVTFDRQCRLPVESGRQEQIIDRFFLGGDNLRGFQIGGAGPHDAITGDPLGGRFIWTQSTELHYPLPSRPISVLSGRAFVDVGASPRRASSTKAACQAREWPALPDLCLCRPTRRRRCRHVVAYPVRSDKC